MLKKSLSILLSFIFIINVFSIVPLYVTANAEEVASGTTGQCIWTIYDNGTLIISGDGKMRDYNINFGSKSPWAKYHIQTVIIENGVTNIGTYAFYDCRNVESVSISSTVSIIGSYAFFGCNKLSSCTIPYGVTSIETSAFNSCNSLVSVTIPNTVIDIQACAFLGCKGLQSVTIPNSVTTIGHDAFNGCNNIKSITISKSVMRIGTQAFSNCWNLTSIIVDKENTIYDCRDSCNAIIETESNTLISGCSNTIIPDSVLYIGDSAFCGCINLTNIIIPNSVKNIGQSAFLYCKSLNSVVIPNSVTTIGSSAFLDCTSLKGVEIPNSVIKIGGSALGYYNGFKMIDGFTICGYTGTTAEEYANNNGFTFIPFIPSTDKKINVNVSSWEAYDETIDEYKYPVENFDFAMGSFAWDKQNVDPNLNTNDNLIDRTNYDKLYLKVEIDHKENDDTEADATDAEVTLTAPDGFSFSRTEIDTEYTCTFNGIHPGETKDMAVEIYPIFSLAYQDGQQIKIDTKVTSTLYDETTDSIAIGSIHKRVREGMISVDQYAEPLSIDLSPELLAQSSYTYVQELARLGIGLSAMEYASDKQIEDSYRNLGFSSIRIYGDTTGYANINNVNFSFASKRIIINKKIVTLIASPVRGTERTNLNEWIGNADAFEQANGDHRSFRNAANNVRENLVWYLKYTASSFAGERKLFLTGHSRGAAVANLLGADIDNDQLKTYISANSAYVYTFATPNTTSDYFISNERYYNIFNIIDYNDVITMVPPRFMGYNKYGLTYSFALNSHYHYYLPQIIENVEQTFTHYTYLEYDPLLELDRITFVYNLAHNILDLFSGSYLNTAIATRSVILDTSDFYQRAVLTHSTANYIAWMESLHNQYEMSFSEVNFRRIEVQCPVDVEIIDSTGKIVGKTTDGIVNDNVSNRDGVLLAVENDHKIIILPDFNDYTIKTVGYDEGTMNVTVIEYEDYAKERVTCYKSTPISSGKYYTISIGQSSFDYQFLSDTGAEIAADEVYDKDQLDSIEISVSISGTGKVKGDGAYTPGEIAVLTAIPEKSVFLGWYLDGALVSSKTEISFVVTEPIAYEAKFAEVIHCHLLGDVDGDETVTILDATYIQRYLASITIPFELNEAIADTDEDGNVAILDTTYIQRWLANLKANDNIGKPINK